MNVILITIIYILEVQKIVSVFFFILIEEYFSFYTFSKNACEVFLLFYLGSILSFTSL